MMYEFNECMIQFDVSFYEGNVNVMLNSDYGPSTLKPKASWFSRTFRKT